VLSSSSLVTYTSDDDNDDDKGSSLTEPTVEVEETLVVVAPLVPSPLLPGWKEVLDKDSNEPYYWNANTGEVSWDRPSAPHVTITEPTSATSSDGDATITSSDEGPSEEKPELGKLPFDIAVDALATLEMHSPGVTSALDVLAVAASKPENHVRHLVLT
jgi:hypothetical protein